MIIKKLVEDELYDFLDELSIHDYLCKIFPEKIKDNKPNCNEDCAQCAINYLKTLYN